LLLLLVLVGMEEEEEEGVMRLRVAAVDIAGVAWT
jgi:hypothetical protein